MQYKWKGVLRYVTHPFLNKTDQPVTNLGSLVKRRTANRMKKKEMAPSAKLKNVRVRNNKISEMFSSGNLLVCIALEL